MLCYSQREGGAGDRHSMDKPTWAASKVYFYEEYVGRPGEWILLRKSFCNPCDYYLHLARSLRHAVMDEEEKYWSCSLGDHRNNIRTQYYNCKTCQMVAVFFCWYLGFGDEDRFILECLESLPTGLSYHFSHWWLRDFLGHHLLVELRNYSA